MVVLVSLAVVVNVLITTIIVRKQFNGTLRNKRIQGFYETSNKARDKILKRVKIEEMSSIGLQQLAIALETVQ